MPLKSRSLASEFFDILGFAAVTGLWPRKLWLVSSTSSLTKPSISIISGEECSRLSKPTAESERLGLERIRYTLEFLKKVGEHSIRHPKNMEGPYVEVKFLLRGFLFSRIRSMYKGKVTDGEWWMTCSKNIQKLSRNFRPLYERG